MVKRSCDKGSWKADPGKEEYPRPADGPQIFFNMVAGPAERQISKARSQSWTASMNIGFADVLSLGVAFEMTETAEDTDTFTYKVPEGQTGDIAFTPFLLCTIGE